MAKKAKKSTKKQVKTSKRTTKPTKPTKPAKQQPVIAEQPTTNALTVVVEKVDSGSTPLPPKQQPTLPKDYPGNQRFVFGKDAKSQKTAAVIDRIAHGKIAEYPMLPEDNERFNVQVRVTAILIRELEKLYADRTFPTTGKDHVRELFGVAITAVGTALAAYN